MDNTKRKTGLGVDALFQPVPQKPVADLPAAAQAKRSKPDPAPATVPEPALAKPKSQKMRTTVHLNPDTLAGMDLYKMQQKRLRKKPSYSEIVDEAIRLFLKVNDVDI